MGVDMCYCLCERGGRYPPFFVYGRVSLPLRQSVGTPGSYRGRRTGFAKGQSLVEVFQKLTNITRVGAGVNVMVGSGVSVAVGDGVADGTAVVMPAISRKSMPVSWVRITSTTTTARPTRVVVKDRRCVCLSLCLVMNVFPSLR